MSSHSYKSNFSKNSEDNLKKKTNLNMSQQKNL